MTKKTWSVLRLAGALVLAPFLSSAQDTTQPMGERAFRLATEGAVFDVYESGVLRQRERFFDDGRVRLGFIPEGQPPDSRAPVACIDGQWSMQDDSICFRYVLPSGERDGPHCWRIFDLGDGNQLAEEADTDSGLVLDLRKTDTPLICRGPDIGV